MGRAAESRPGRNHRRSSKKKTTSVRCSDRRVRLVAFQQTRQPPQSSARSDAEAVSHARELIRQVDAAEGALPERWDEVLKQQAVSSDAFVEIVARLNRVGRHDMAVEALQSAMRRNQAQAWMYSVLPLEMKLAKRPQADIDRALLSRLDFAGTTSRKCSSGPLCFRG